MFKSIALAATLSLAAFSVAQAEGSFASASLSSPVSRATQVIAGGAVWTCEGSSCRAPVTSDATLSVSACKQLAREAGPVVDYAVDRQKLSDAELQRCNGGRSPR